MDLWSSFTFVLCVVVPFIPVALIIAMGIKESLFPRGKTVESRITGQQDNISSLF